MMRFGFTVIATLGAVFTTASYVFADVPPPEARAASIVFLGEQHDNPAHHEVQAAWVAELQPAAIVFEMLTEAQADGITPAALQDEAALERALSWNESGWPDFAMYYPIFAAAPEARVFGAAVPRAQIGDIMKRDLADVAGPEITTRFALDAKLPDAQLAQRLDLQSSAHCDALPEAFLPRMVDVQRLRDAVLAQTALHALQTAGGSVVVITGNGHAREDWGAPFLIKTAEPDVSVFSLGQGEDGKIPTGGFTAVLDGPAVDRGDPCAVFD
ncbi:MAG: ChaN family lipoprotein [Pseudomonadota bacterium]